MVVGYAAFNTELKISGTSKVTSNWDIRITNVTDGTPTGSAKNTVKPSWTTLTASMEADLYKKGDAMEYDVTIENRGTLDAKLNDILTNTQNSNSEAVIITFSGYTKGEVLEHGKSKLVHVKIEYNPNYDGEPTPSEVEVKFDYTQENKDLEAPQSYLVKYDCVTNGGEDCSQNDEYMISGSEVNLNKQGNKQGYEFIGWNTDKDALVGLNHLTVENNNITLYAIYKAKDTTKPIIDKISTTSTTNSITVVVSAHDDESKIVKYEYSLDGGKNWIDNGNNNTYTFTNLKPNTTYDILVRVTNESNLTAQASAITSIDITENTVESGDGLYKDEYEDGRYVYKGTDPNNYIEYNGELWRIVSKEANGTYKIVRNEVLEERNWNTSSNNNWAEATLKEYLNGEYYENLTAEAKGYIEVSNWPIGAVSLNNDNITEQIASERGKTWNGKVGLLTHSDYLRANPNNYIIFNNETWRIISVDYNGLIKIMKNESIGNRAFDSESINDWETSDIKTYLNGEYLNSITTNKNKIISHTWSIGAVTFENTDLEEQINVENGTQSQSVSIGMITASEYIRANSNTGQCGNLSINNSNCSTCNTTNWMYDIAPSEGGLWTITPSDNSIFGVYHVNVKGSNGGVDNGPAINSNGVSPSLYLTSEIELTGAGTQSNPYRIIS